MHEGMGTDTATAAMVTATATAMGMLRAQSPSLPSGVHSSFAVLHSIAVYVSTCAVMHLMSTMPLLCC